MKRRSGQTNHYARIDKYVAYIDSLFNDAVHKATLAASQVKPNPEKPFRLNDFPAIRARIERISKLLFSQVEVVIKKASETEWNFSNEENDKLVKSVFPDKQPDQYMNHNLDALSSFEKRKVDGMNLSDRVWKLDPVFKSELEMAIDIGLSDGRSAAELSRDIRQYLQKPDKLFRRVRDKNGVLQLSKAAKGYNPGTGVYRSSYKNAMRLARTEINMAYHNADFERWQQLDFVVGIEIELSNNHPVNDICDDLKGRYPKEFKFTGWHPQCRCHALTILASKDEFQEMNRKILAGEDYETQSENEIKDVPDSFKKWISDNEQRMKGWKSKPYFVRDNVNFIHK